MYRGPKPYDPDRFTKALGLSLRCFKLPEVSMSVRLLPKQASNTKIMNQVGAEGFSLQRASRRWWRRCGASRAAIPT